MTMTVLELMARLSCYSEKTVVKVAQYDVDGREQPNLDIIEVNEEAEGDSLVVTLLPNDS
ncbi:MAG: hypothetical protein E6R03_17060 [Hyphomicrobiaceae bacterium]|nr:MAG: hypothetical protein E6R03_17060 [Hyphomicrobiaceae bacterium]